MVAIKTNLQVYMTPANRQEAADLITSNTGREYLLRLVFPSPLVRCSAVHLEYVKERQS